MVKIFIEILNSNKWKSNNGEIFTSLEFFNSLFDIMKFIAINNKNKELNHHVNINKVQGILEDIPMVLESTISILQIDECFSLILPVAYEYLGEYPKTIMVLCLMNPKSFSQIIRKKESNILSSYAIGKDLFIHSGIIKKNIIILIREGKVISYEKIANRMYKRNAFNHKIRQELLIYIEPIIQKRKNKFIQKVNSIIKNLSFYHNIYIIIDDYCNMDKKNHVKQLIKEIMDDFREKIGTFEKNIKNLKQIDLIKEKYSKKEVNLKIYHFCTLIFNNKVPGVRFYDASKFRNLFPLLNEKKKLFNENTIQKPKFIFKFREKKLSV